MKIKINIYAKRNGKWTLYLENVEVVEAEAAAEGTKLAVSAMGKAGVKDAKWDVAK
jgi:hypothetical protein